MSDEVDEGMSNAKKGPRRVHDLLGNEFVGHEDSEMSMFVPYSPESDDQYATHEAITIKRGSDIVASLQRALETEAQLAELQ